MRRILLAVACLASTSRWLVDGAGPTSPILRRTRSVLHKRQRQPQPLQTRSSTSTSSYSPSSSTTSSALHLRGGAVSSLVPADASTGLKLGLMAGLTALHCACWLIPLHMKSFTENETVMSIANSFSGGVFLSLAFGHLLPEAVHDFTQSGGSEVVPCAVTALGYFLIFVVEKVIFSTDTLLDTHHHHNHHGGSDGDGDGAGGRGAVGAVLLLTALGVHSLVETMALGVQSTAKSAWLLAASIGLHQPAESLALLVALVKSGLSKQRIIMLLTAFTLVGPLGVLCGIAAREVIGGRAEALLVALTAGTFIYVGATEVVGEEFEAPVERKWAKFGAFSGGVVAIVLIIGMVGRLEGGMD